MITIDYIGGKRGLKKKKNYYIIYEQPLIENIIHIAGPFWPRHTFQRRKKCLTYGLFLATKYVDTICHFICSFSNFPDCLNRRI